MINKLSRRTFLIALSSTTFAFPFLSNPSLSFAQNKSNKKKMGVALVGLGNYSTNMLAPALEKTKNCYLAGIVTGSPEKIPVWKKKYNIPDKNVYNYETFDQIKDNKDIDVIYIVLPNGMHAEYTIRAAQAKKHVICEKPMATSVEDAEKMVKACNENNVLLGVGYRLHYEPFNQRVMELGQQKIFGKVKSITAKDSSYRIGSDPDHWRLDKKLSGGGPLMDLGIYCVQGAIYTLGDTPVAVTARFGKVTHPKYFDDVEQSVEWEMHFKNDVVANCHTSYAADEDILRGEADKGWWEVSPAFTYWGKKGRTSKEKMNFPNVFEQVHQMDAQCASFLKNETPITSGEMGLRDVRILMAIYESANNAGKRVELKF